MREVEHEHYTTTEAAEKLRMTPDGVLKRIKRGQLPGMHIGHRWLIPKATLDAMLQQVSAPQGTQGRGPRVWVCTTPPVPSTTSTTVVEPPMNDAPRMIPQEPTMHDADCLRESLTSVLHECRDAIDHALSLLEDRHEDPETSETHSNTEHLR
jgi:excisionase family DNA binding protein